MEMMKKELLEKDTVRQLLEWYRKTKRDLPWRATNDPYRIWVSEIMLQQTRVEAVKPYYERFMKVFPNVRSLAEANEETLLKMWEGLGYYSRARNLQKAAKTMMAEHGGELPRSYDQLRKLSGIGEYTAGAIASIAFGIPVPAIDGNVLRVLARVMGSYDDIMLPQTKKNWREALSPCIPSEAAGDFTQAMIELGATVCVPNGEPKCAECPMRSICVASNNDLTAHIPVRTAKKARRIEERTVFLIVDGNRTVLGKRPPKGLLAGLYELPNTSGYLDETQAVAHLRSIGFEPLRLRRLEDAKHIFTHIEWHMIAYAVQISPDFDGVDEKWGYSLIDNDDLKLHYAIPSAFSAYSSYLHQPIDVQIF